MEKLRIEEFFLEITSKTGECSITWLEKEKTQFAAEIFVLALCDLVPQKLILPILWQKVSGRNPAIYAGMLLPEDLVGSNRFIFWLVYL